MDDCILNFSTEPKRPQKRTPTVINKVKATLPKVQQSAKPKETVIQNAPHAVEAKPKFKTTNNKFPQISSKQSETKQTVKSVKTLVPLTGGGQQQQIQTKKRFQTKPSLDARKPYSTATTTHSSKLPYQEKEKQSLKWNDKPRLSNMQDPKSNPDPGSESKEQVQLVDLMSESVKPQIEPVFSASSWADFGKLHNLHQYLVTCITDRLKLKRLTAIQSTTIPQLLDSKDALVRAQTGSGKTLAYLVPLLHGLISIEPPVTRAIGPLALIILPTRELAAQTYEVLHQLGNSCVRIVSGSLASGIARSSQKASLRKGINIVVGTPQRILDHIGRTSSLDLGRLAWLVIDEADRLMELGFERDVRQILEHVKRVRQTEDDLQTVLLSATLTPGVDLLAGLALTDPTRCVVQESGGHEGEASDAFSTSFSLPSGLKHFSLIVPWKARMIHLAAFLLLKCRYHHKAGKVIVFMATQSSVDYHYNLLRAVLCPDADESDSIIPDFAANLQFFRLHGNMEHKVRQSEFVQFSKSRSGILLTTDVASRGLDLPSVAWVIQFHSTGKLTDYVHRVGRTARAGGRGKSLVLLDPDEVGFIDLLTSKMGVELRELSSEEVMQTALFHLKSTKPAPTKASQRHKRPPQDYLPLPFIISRFSRLFFDVVDNDQALQKQAELAFVSFIRSYAGMDRELRPCFQFHRLHLGHVAHAFVLSMTPKQIMADLLQWKRKGQQQDEQRPGKRRLAIDYSSKASTDEAGAMLDDVTQNGPDMFKRPRMSKSSWGGSAKPEDLAKQNMLAEFGL